MKELAPVIAIVLLLAGCAPMSVDRDFGTAQKNAWDRQIAFPDAPYADGKVTGTAGITAEEIMAVHNQTFAEKPQEVQVFQFDLANSGQ